MLSKQLRTGSIVAASAGAALAAWNTYQARRVERQHPPAGSFITIEGVRLHYLEKGAGLPVVLLHGNIVTAEDFALSGLLDQLGAGYRAIAFDRPGFGHSSRPRGAAWPPARQAGLLRRAFAELDIERPVVVGHSWGTLVALALALDHPDAVGGLVLLSGYYHPTLRADVPLFSLPAIPVIGDLIRYTAGPIVGTAIMPMLVKGMFAPLPVAERFATGFPYGFAVRPQQIRAQAQDAAAMVAAAAAMQSRYRELRVPVVIMAGTDDRVVQPQRQAAVLHRAIPQSTIRLLPGVGHMLHYAAPEEILDAVKRIAGRHPLDGATVGSAAAESPA